MTKHSKIKSTTGIIEYIALNDLTLSEQNPRQDCSSEGIDLLAQSLVACGLIQNLAGVRKDKGKVAIIAGGRRLRALKLAVKQRPELALVPVQIAPDAQTAVQWANAENTARVDLDPADEIRAYGRMAAEHHSAAKIAQVFAVTEAHVYRRLALANLPNEVLDALQAGDISLGTAKLFTTSNDDAQTLEILEQIKGQEINEYHLKGLLHPDAVDSQNRLARFVGLPAYEAKGGETTRDLFADTVLLHQPELLHSLFVEKLAEESIKLAETEGWLWVSTVEDSYLSYYEMEDAKYAQIYPVRGELNDQQDARFEELSELDCDDVLDAEGQVELDALNAIQKGAFSDAQKTCSGLIVYVDQQGEIKATRGLVRPADKASAIAAGVLPEPERKATAAKGLYSQKLQRDLDAIKLAARQTAMLDKPDLMLDLLAFHFCAQSGFAEIFALRGEYPNVEPSSETGFNLDARFAPDKGPKNAWNVDLPKAFAAFRKKGGKHRTAELTRQLAFTLKGGSETLAALIDKEAAADIRSIWTPTAENFFMRITASALESLFCSLLELRLDGTQAKNFKRLKKAEKATLLGDLFSNEATRKTYRVTKAQAEIIDAWLPEGMRG